MSEVEKFDKSKLKKAETAEKNPLPTKEGVAVFLLIPCSLVTIMNHVKIDGNFKEQRTGSQWFTGWSSIGKIIRNSGLFVRCPPKKTSTLFKSGDVKIFSKIQE
ncbi:hypothetical protein HELRODRAFT_175630 [Helobdella robusta]|uniref:Uncharacterized protein n=1 Tax=Helobdella robusta TaxID=6412 RepID=T1F9G0_HELRO|nr:hypothetical protein HELRODRAFT_175630 [Helobdella robusta]ESO00651.1 hypothetical protein HELRODRAFT_175630 [Helobdella robusta]